MVIKYSDLKFSKNKCIINEEAYKKILVYEKLITPEQNMADLEKLGYKFMLSFYKDEIIQYEKNGEYFTECFLSRTMPKQRNYIETKPIDAPQFEKQPRHLVGLGKTTSIKK